MIRLYSVSIMIMNCWHKAIREGFIEILLLNSLISSVYFTLPNCVISILAQCITYFIDRHLVYLIAACGMYVLRIDSLTVFYSLCFLMSLCLPSNNYFERTIFAAVLALGLAYESEQSIVNYLIKCIPIQMIMIGVLLTLRLRKGIPYFLLAFNLLAAIYCLYSNLHLYLIQSPNLINVLIYGSLGIALTIALSLLVKLFNLPNIYIRKVFHIPPLILFPIFSNKFPDIFLTALIGAIYTFIILEFLRYYSNENQETFVLKGLKTVWEYMEKFLDSRDQHFWVTHISLLLGMSISYFVNTGVTKHSSVILPISDAFAAIIGTKFGQIKIGKKSLEGMMGFIMTSLLMFWVFGYLTGQSIGWLRVSASVCATSTLQLLSTQVDNLLLPLFFSYLYLSV